MCSLRVALGPGSTGALWWGSRSGEPVTLEDVRSLGSLDTASGDVVRGVARAVLREVATRALASVEGLPPNYEDEASGLLTALDHVADLATELGIEL